MQLPHLSRKGTYHEGVRSRLLAGERLRAHTLRWRPVVTARGGAPLPPPVQHKGKKWKRHPPPPPPPPRDGVLTIDGWIRFSVSVQEQQLLIGVRQKLDALLASKIESPDMQIEAGAELLAAVTQVLSSN